MTEQSNISTITGPARAEGASAFGVTTQPQQSLMQSQLGSDFVEAICTAYADRLPATGRISIESIQARAHLIMCDGDETESFDAATSTISGYAERMLALHHKILKATADPARGGSASHSPRPPPGDAAPSTGGDRGEGWAA